MSDATISQDEIDALLSGVDMGGIGSSGSAGVDTATLGKFAEEQKGKLLNNINTMSGSSFSVGDAVVESVDRDQLLVKLPDKVVAVMADFNEGLVGDHLFIMAPDFAQKLASLVNNEDISDVDDMTLALCAEAIQNYVGAEITALSAGGKFPGLASQPPESVHDLKAVVRIPQGTFALVTYPLVLDGTTYTVWEAIGSAPAEEIARSLGGGHPPAGAGNGALNANDMASIGSYAAGGMGMGGMQMPMMNMGQPAMSTNMNVAPPNVQSLQFPNLQGGAMGAEQGNIGLIMDVFMEMTVELGRAKKTIKDILGMGEGTIIELDKLAGEPVDILVNHKKIAKGEVVVIDESFGVRVTEILSPNERVI